MKNIFRTAIKDGNGTFIRWQTVHDLVHRIMSLKELRDFWPSCDGLVVDEGLQIAGDDYDTIFLLQAVLSQRLVVAGEPQWLVARTSRVDLARSGAPFELGGSTAAPGSSSAAPLSGSSGSQSVLGGSAL